MTHQRLSTDETRFTCKLIGTLWASAFPVIAVATFNSPHAARAVPAFAQQTGQPCKSCHVGGFGPELTKVGREFKLGGYVAGAFGGPARRNADRIMDSYQQGSGASS